MQGTDAARLFIVAKGTAAKCGDSMLTRQRCCVVLVRCRQLARWCADNRGRIQEIDPALPIGVFNRLADNWRPLFAIAEVAGEDWPNRCAEAFVKLSSQNDTDSESLRVNLLDDIRQIFTSDRMFSKDVIDALKDMTERPWSEICRGKPIN